MGRKRKREIEEPDWLLPEEDGAEEEAGEEARASQDAPADEAPSRGLRSLLKILREREDGADELLEEEEGEEDEEDQGDEEDEGPREPDKLAHVIGMCIFAVLLIAALGMTYIIMRIDTIRIYGNDRVSTEAISALLDISPGQNLLLIDTGAAEARLQTNPYVAEAKLTRLYPSTLRVDITERAEAAAVIGLSTAAIVDSEGYVLSIGEREDYTGLLKIYGAGSAGYQVNQRLGEASDYTSRTLVAVIEAITQAELGNTIESVDISNVLSVTMQTFSGFTVQIGQPEDLDTKMRNLKVVLPEIKALGYTSGTIDLSVHGDPVFAPPAPAQGVDIEPIIPENPLDMPENSPDPPADGEDSQAE